MPNTEVWLRLNIEHVESIRPADVFGTVDNVLDDGSFQDAINEGNTGVVRSAMSMGANAISTPTIEVVKRTSDWVARLARDRRVWESAPSQVEAVRLLAARLVNVVEVKS